MPSAPKQIPLFIPRQIMLQNPNAAAAAASAEKKKRKEEKKARKLAAAAAPPDPDVVADGGGGKSRGGKARKLLLRSICGFLESSGFEKTLAAFRSEAEMPIDGEKASVLNLEDLFCKFLESRSSEDATTDRPEERDMKNSVPAEDAHVKMNDKKKKRKPILNPNEENNEEASHGKTNTVREHDLLENDVNDKEKRKKKSKKSCDPSDGKSKIGENGDFHELVEKHVEELKTLSATPAADSNPKPSGEKRKKTKRCSAGSAGNAVELETEAFQERIKKKSKESVTVETSTKDVLLNADSKNKDKKKKKDKTKTKDREESHDAGDGDATASIKDVSEEIISSSKKSKKRKQLASEERAPEPEIAVEAKDSKHARLDGAEDTTISNIDLLTEHKENPGSCESPKQSKEHLSANGDLEKQNGGDTSSKMLKKEKHSAEPTTNSFRRVKLEEVEFVDERLQNNSYWAKGGADSGYGAKAQEILGQVKGRNFRHEKTKKKRGSYRGGQIDLESHSIKFNYSDEE